MLDLYKEERGTIIKTPKYYAKIENNYLYSVYSIWLYLFCIFIVKLHLLPAQEVACPLSRVDTVSVWGHEMVVGGGGGCGDCWAERQHHFASHLSLHTVCVYHQPLNGCLLYGTDVKRGDRKRQILI